MISAGYESHPVRKDFQFYRIDDHENLSLCVDVTTFLMIQTE